MPYTSLPCLSNDHIRCYDPTCACSVCRHGTVKVVRQQPKKDFVLKPMSEKKRPSRAKKQPGERRADYGKSRGVLKVEPERVEQIRRMLGLGMSRNEISRLTGVSRDQVFTVEHGHSRRMECHCGQQAA